MKTLLTKSGLCVSLLIALLLGQALAQPTTTVPTVTAITIRPAAPVDVAKSIGKLVNLLAYTALAAGIVLTIGGSIKWAYGDRDSGRRWVIGGLAVIVIISSINILITWLLS